MLLRGANTRLLRVGWKPRYEKTMLHYRLSIFEPDFIHIIIATSSFPSLQHCESLSGPLIIQLCKSSFWFGVAFDLVWSNLSRIPTVIIQKLSLEHRHLDLLQTHPRWPRRVGSLQKRRPDCMMDLERGWHFLFAYLSGQFTTTIPLLLYIP